jgi:hypothetical protein
MGEKPRHIPKCRQVGPNASWERKKDSLRVSQMVVPWRTALWLSPSRLSQSQRTESDRCADKSLKINSIADTLHALKFIDLKEYIVKRLSL